MQKTNQLKWAFLAALTVVLPIALIRHATASDHADTPEIASSPGTDLTDVFVFPSPTNPSNVVFVMTVNPLITPATKSSVSFDPNVLYQFKIDNTGDAVEDMVIQARFNGVGASQQCYISGPVAPKITGTSNEQLPPNATAGLLNKSFSPTTGMMAFCGVREDPFFFDLEQFFNILPDRATPISGKSVPIDKANDPQDTKWRAKGVAKDFLSVGGYNVLAIVVEVPKSKLGGGSKKIGVWCTTSVSK